MQSLILANLSTAGLALTLIVGMLAMLHLNERLLSRFVAYRLGWRAVLVTGWLGVPLHELAHLVFAHFFGHRIVGWRLFDPDPVTGTLGYVHHAYRKRTAWQIMGNFFIGIAPSLVGLGLIALLWLWMVPYESLAELWSLGRRLEQPTLAAMTGQTFEILWLFPSELARFIGHLAAAAWQHRTWLLPLQVYLGICVVAHMAPSGADLRGAAGGFFVFLLCIALVATLLAWAGESIILVISVVSMVLVVIGMMLAFQVILMGVVGIIGRLLATR